MTAKYVIFDRAGELVPCLWPNHTGVQHVEVEARLAGLGWRALSAGFCLPADGWRCFGESLSIGLKSRGAEDTAIMLHWFGLPSQQAGPAPRDPFPHHD